MTDEPKPDSAIANALKKRRRLQAEIQRAMQELEEVEKFITLHRRFSGEDEVTKGEVTSQAPTILSQAGSGKTQSVFERLAIDVIRQTGRPMQSGEIVDAFRARGHPIGGNETRTAWNRLWLAKDRGALVNFPRLGYWPAEDPPPANLDHLEPQPRKPSGGKRRQIESRGKRKGRKPYFNDAQKEQVLAMFARGMTGPQIATEMGVSTALIYEVKNKWRKEPTEENK